MRPSSLLSQLCSSIFSLLPGAMQRNQVRGTAFHEGAGAGPSSPCSTARYFPAPGTASGRYVEEDRRRLRKAARRAVYGAGRTELGNLSVWWMRAALVVRVDLRVEVLPEIRRAGSSIWSEIRSDEEPPPSIWWRLWFPRRKGRGFHQELWIAPTRRPAELRVVLAQAAEAGLFPAVDNPALSSSRAWQGLNHDEARVPWLP